MTMFGETLLQKSRGAEAWSVCMWSICCTTSLHLKIELNIVQHLIIAILLYRQQHIVSLSSDKGTYCKSLWIKASANCLKLPEKTKGAAQKVNYSSEYNYSCIHDELRRLTMGPTLCTHFTHTSPFSIHSVLVCGCGLVKQHQSQPKYCSVLHLTKYTPSRLLAQPICAGVHLRV